MPDILAELESNWDHAAGALRHLMHHGAPQPAAAPPAPQIAHNETQEDHMSLNLATIEDHVKAAVAEFENLDREALAKLDAVQANPATAEIFAIASQLTHLPPTDLATGASVLRMILATLGGRAPQQPVPSGPVTGGQA